MMPSNRYSRQNQRACENTTGTQDMNMATPGLNAGSRPTFFTTPRRALIKKKKMNFVKSLKKLASNTEPNATINTLIKSVYQDKTHKVSLSAIKKKASEKTQIFYIITPSNKKKRRRKYITSKKFSNEKTKDNEKNESLIITNDKIDTSTLYGEENLSPTLTQKVNLNNDKATSAETKFQLSSKLQDDNSKEFNQNEPEITEDKIEDMKITCEEVYHQLEIESNTNNNAIHPVISKDDGIGQKHRQDQAGKYQSGHAVKKFK